MDAQLLALVLDEVIPPTADGRLPGAGTLGAGAIVQHAASSIQHVRFHSLWGFEI